MQLVDCVALGLIPNTQENKDSSTPCDTSILDVEAGEAEGQIQEYPLYPVSLGPAWVLDNLSPKKTKQNDKIKEKHQTPPNKT